MAQDKCNFNIITFSDLVSKNSAENSIIHRHKTTNLEGDTRPSKRCLFVIHKEPIWTWFSQRLFRLLSNTVKGNTVADKNSSQQFLFIPHEQMSEDLNNSKQLTGLAVRQVYAKSHLIEI